MAAGLLLLSLNTYAIEKSGQIRCREYALPDESKLDQFISSSMKISGELCNQEVTRVAVKKLTDAHLCRDIKLDPGLQSKIKKRLDCDAILSPIKTPQGCLPHLDDEAKKLLAIHARISSLEKDSSPEQLHNDLLTIYMNRLIVNGERAPGRGGLRAYVTNNLPSIAFGVLKENTNLDVSKKSDYLVCVEQTYRFLDSSTPESMYLRFKGYTLDFYDETSKKDKGDQVAHAYTQLTAPDGKLYVFDSWRGESKPFDSKVTELNSRGANREMLRAKPIKNY